MQPVFRFAPSPNGALHLGHAFSALLNADMAERLGGRLLIRIEDIDTVRCTPELTAAMLDDLRWLGLDFAPPLRQSQQFARYADLLAQLDARGLIWQSFETRAELKAAALPSDPDGAPRLDGSILPAAEIARRSEAGAPFAWRLHMLKALETLATPLTWQEVDSDGSPLELVRAAPERWGDVILARKETPTSYHLAVVADDAAQGVTHVVRGRDLYESTAVHRLLQTLLGLPEPLYHHHRLILDDDGRKLSKSRASTALAALRTGGQTAHDIRHRIGL